MTWGRGLGLIALGFGALIASRLLLVEEPDVASEPEATNMEFAQPTQDGANDAALWARLRRIEGELAAARETTTQEVSGEVATNEPTDEPVDPATMSPDELEQYLERRTYERAIYRSQLEDTMDQEAVDPAWATAAEDEINRSIRSVDMENIDVYGVECRARYCRVELTFAAGTDPQETMGELTRQPGFAMQGMADFETDPDGTERVFVFLAREGAEFPEPA